MPALKKVLFLISTANTRKVSRYGVFFGAPFHTQIKINTAL